MPNNELFPMLEKSFLDPDFALPGGQSNSACQERSISVLKKLLSDYPGKRIALGTHGAVMTLMMNYFDNNYGMDFLPQTTKPDVYRMEFLGEKLSKVTRLWGAVQPAIS